MSYQLFKEKMTQIADLQGALALMSWDQETYMPKGGAEIRSQQRSTLAALRHQLATDKALGTLMKDLISANNLSELELKNVTLAYEDYQERIIFPESFVIKESQAISRAFTAWSTARAKNDFSIFEPALQTIVDLRKEEIALRGVQTTPYDTLLDQYDKGLNVKDLDTLFTKVKSQLVPYIKDLKTKYQADDSVLKQFYPKDKQWNFGIKILESMGYDFNHGRQDIAAHPFSTSFAATDSRITTRIDEHDMSNMLFSCIHEGGHALYEQGLPIEQYGLPLGDAISLSVHESQSRLWENNVGKSKEFWHAHYRALQEVFPENLATVSFDNFYRAINKVSPNLVRTEADEMHYHLHVLVRYEIEKDLFNGTLEVKDLKEAWNSKYKEYLGVEVPDDKQGILQDVHWSHGSFGYFPTYSLGSFLAAQLFHFAALAIPNLKEEISKGNTEVLKNWLRINIHSKGRLYTTNEISKMVTGETLNFDYFFKYITHKFDNMVAENL